MFASVFGFYVLHTIIELKGNPVKYGGSTRYCNLHPAQAELLLTKCHCADCERKHEKTVKVKEARRSANTIC